MRERRFIQCDVFTSEPTRGNGLAIVVDALGLSDDQLQRFAAWTNLAETAFLFPPEEPTADYRVRIFTPTREMPFAGHPTLGSCAAWLHAGGEAKQPGVVRQECGVGIVDIDVEGNIPAFVAPPTAVEPLFDADFCAILEALEIESAQVVRSARLDNGPVWRVLELTSAQAVLNADSSLVRWPAYKSIGLIGPHPEGSECDYEVRMLAPSSGMSEDPITGSLNAAIAQWMSLDSRLPRRLLIAQGTRIGRAGRVHVGVDGKGRVMIGGMTHILIDGSVLL